SAVARPIPVPPPVTMADWPANSSSRMPPMALVIDPPNSEVEDAADVPALAHVVVAEVDVVELVGSGDEFVELQLTVAVEADELRDVGTGSGRAEQAPKHALLQPAQGEHAQP